MLYPLSYEGGTRGVSYRPLRAFSLGLCGPWQACVYGVGASDSASRGGHVTHRRGLLRLSPM